MTLVPRRCHSRTSQQWKGATTELLLTAAGGLWNWVSMPLRAVCRLALYLPAGCRASNFSASADLPRSEEAMASNLGV